MFLVTCQSVQVGRLVTCILHASHSVPSTALSSLFTPPDLRFAPAFSASLHPHLLSYGGFDGITDSVGELVCS